MSCKLIIGCGYLGERVARVWLESSHEVAVLTRSPENADRFRAQGLVPFVGDMHEPATLADLPKADTLLYAVGFDRNSGRTRREVYVDGLRNVLNAVAGRVDRFIYISSTSVYGQASGETIDEESACKPTRDNGRVCLEAEQTVWEFFPRQHGASAPSATILRLAGIYGPDRLLRRIEQVKNTTPIAGNPEAFLNLIHVDDAARAVIACEERGTSNGLYLVADDMPVRRRDYYSRLASLLDAPAPTFVESRDPTSNLNKRCSNRKLREALGAQLRYPTIETGLPHALGLDD